MAIEAGPCDDGEMLALAVLLATAPISLDCVQAHRQRNDLAVRMQALLTREVDQGSLNRAEIGALRSAARRRDRLLDCPADRDL